MVELKEMCICFLAQNLSISFRRKIHLKTALPAPEKFLGSDYLLDSCVKCQEGEELEF